MHGVHSLSSYGGGGGGGGGGGYKISGMRMLNILGVPSVEASSKFLWALFTDKPICNLTVIMVTNIHRPNYGNIS